MINETLNKIEQRLEASSNLKPENREALESLLSELRTEVDAMEDSLEEKADSITGFAEASTREALREDQDPDLLDLNLAGLEKSVREFEASHPKLTSVVNGICKTLSDLGI